MKVNNDRSFELKLGKKALILFVLGVSLLLFTVFLLGVRIGKIMDAHPETVAMGFPYVVMECFGWSPKKVETDAAISKAPKELAAEEENKQELTFYDTLAQKKNDTKIAEKVTPEESPPPVSEKPLRQVNTEETVKRPVKPSEKSSAPATTVKLPVKSSDKSTAAAVKEAYQIQVISLKEKEKADELCKKLIKLGYSPRIITTDLQDRGKWHRVVINGFNSQEQAQKAKNVVSKKISGLNCVIKKKE